MMLLAFLPVKELTMHIYGIGLVIILNTVIIKLYLGRRHCDAIRVYICVSQVRGGEYASDYAPRELGRWPGHRIFIL